MSAESIERIYRRFVDDVDNACGEGRGKEHMLDYFRALAAELASSVFLAIETAARDITPEQTEAFLIKIAEQGEQRGFGLVEGIRETLVTFRAPEEMIAEAESVTARVYRDELAKLFTVTTSMSGGSA